MEMYQLRAYVTAATLGSVTRTAETLHVTQPAITAQIKALEEDIGTALFERTAGGLRMTQAGQELLPQAQVRASSPSGICPSSPATPCAPVHGPPFSQTAKPIPVPR